ncbi:MAG: hypothetical protein JXD22_04120 [Sedimentisphaerales bacterium]|nr:hypothetical protein [Sedimentisphaerales bacterium]
MSKDRQENKLCWQGNLISVHPRIRLLRSFDQRSHSYLGYALNINGMIGDEERVFLVGIGKGAQAKHKFQAGDIISGQCQLVEDNRLETVEFYKVSKLKMVRKAKPQEDTPPPWLGVPPDIETYRVRGHRRLDVRTYERKCQSCIWGCIMAVEMIIDQWNPSQKKYRQETFCYGPKSCAFYKPGPTRKVPGRKGMTWEEEDWVDEDATSRRGVDD